MIKKRRQRVAETGKKNKAEGVSFLALAAAVGIREGGGRLGELLYSIICDVFCRFFFGWRGVL